MWINMMRLYRSEITKFWNSRMFYLRYLEQTTNIHTIIVKIGFDMKVRLVIVQSRAPTLASGI